MVELAVKYAFKILRVKKATLLANNPAAYNCYKDGGFIDISFCEGGFPKG